MPGGMPHRKGLVALAIIVLLGACAQNANRADHSYSPPLSLVGELAPEKGVQLATLSTVRVESRKISCVPYARMISGIEVRGDAWTWWKGAAGKYSRGTRPIVGAVMVMKRGGNLDRGHVAVVTAIVNDREIRIDHANWKRGELHHGALVQDVSEKNDWSLVRVWYPAINGYGTGRYPIAGFIYPSGANTLTAGAKIF